MFALWVIYYHPKDYPGKFVVRRWYVNKGAITPDNDCKLADSLTEARGHAPDGFARSSPLAGSDPVICEVWI